MCGVTFDQSVNLTQNLISPPAGSDNPQQIAGTDVFQFSASSSASTTSRYTMDATVKNNSLDFTDHFSTTAWIKSVSNGQINQYVFSFDDSANNRVYTWRLRATRLTIFYRRARLDNIDPAQTDSGENGRVGLSFYFRDEVIPDDSIFDSQWHFYKLDIDYPSIKLYVDGYLHMATEGHHFDVTGITRVTLTRGDVHDMPARIIEKDAVYKSQVTGRIGGTQRYSGRYNFNGFLRLLFISSTMNNEQYTCIASCNTSLVPAGYTPGSEHFNTTVGSFSVLYQPVSRILYFDTNANSSVYTTFLKSLSYNTNGFLPAQTVANTGEGRRLELKVTKYHELFL